MKNNRLLLLAPMVAALLGGCGGGKTTVSIHYEGDETTVQFAIDEIKTALENNGMSFVDSGGEYEIEFASLDSSLGTEGYSVAVDGKKITVTGGDATGAMYGGMQVAEEIAFTESVSGVVDSTGTPYLKDRGFRLIPQMDARTPCYTANGDATRANFENTWDLSFWDGLFARMARMRYNLFDMATLCAFPSVIKVEGYEDCALDDIWVYDGEYDDTYYGNGTNMFRPEHIEEGNYHVYKTMTIDEKIEHWKAVIASAHDHGIRFQYDIMNIYSFSEQITSNYGIDNDRANEVTKDYLHKATETLLNTYDIDILNVTAGENMDYPADTKMVTEQWMYDVYGQACIDAYGGKRAKDEFALTYSITDENWSLWSDFPFQRSCATRYADTHMYAVTAPVYSQDVRDALPEGTYDTYNLRNEDAYHFTWAEPDWAREFCKNMKQPKASGFVLGSAGYYMGKEYEFIDTTQNGGYYYDRHFMNYTMFGRFSYNPELTNEWLAKKFEVHFKEAA
ncbi:MAG: glycoside hydrolase family 20 zincin-like fold domain-containing protein, partial [Bacilli bacterium]|nr:glycoside hydrolase family 20 zincin-like fold domain-containing protein [Bacilli bacterium]